MYSCMYMYTRGVHCICVCVPRHTRGHATFITHYWFNVEADAGGIDGTAVVKWSCDSGSDKLMRVAMDWNMTGNGPC